MSANAAPRNGWVIHAPGGGWEYPAFLAIASVALWLVGDGALVIRRSSLFTFDA